MAKKTPADTFLARVRELCFKFPGTEEKLSYGAPAFHVRGRIFAYVGDDPDGGVAALCKSTPAEQQRLVAGDPERFYVPKYFGAKGWVGVRLDHPRADLVELAILVEEAWASVAPKSVAREPARPPPAKPPARVTTDPKVARAALERVATICDALPGSTTEREGRHATFSVSDRAYAHFLDNHHGDGHIAVCVRVPKPRHEALVREQPSRFYLPAYIGARGWVGAMLEARDVDWKDVAERIAASYDAVAPRRARAATPRGPARAAPARRRA